MAEKFYMLGVCGMGMAPLAAFLKDGGADVSGFDDTPNAQIKSELEKIGVRFEPMRPVSADTEVVISSALKRRIGEIKSATNCRKLSLRGECWARVCASRRLTAVVGSHGKSTVSALLAHAALKNGKTCGHLVGAIPNGFAMRRHCPDGERLVSEIDESDGTIELFSPDVCAALNADLDHIDTYPDGRSLEGMFERLFSRTKKAVLYPAGDGVLKRIAAKCKTPSRAVDAGGGFLRANRAMALAAYEETFGESADESVFDDFAGLARRQEILCDTPKVRAVADYAHHPSEVKSFLDWFFARSEGEKIVVFQPHRYTRTRRFAREFAEILGESARQATVILLPVYPASEPFDPLGESGVIAQKSERIMLANPGECLKIISDKLNAPGAGKIDVAAVGAGDFYFAAKKFFGTIK